MKSIRVITLLKKVTYVLVVYKGTRIIHTIYPFEKRKKSTKFLRGNYWAQHQPDGTVMAFVPYYNSEGTKKYAVNVIYDQDKNLEQWLLLVIKNSKPEHIYDIGKGELNVNSMDQLHKRINGLDFMDFSKIEKLLSDIDKGKI